MTDYRLYRLDGDGKIGFAEWIQAASDQEAIGAAERMWPDATRCEIWQRNRLVAKLNGSGQFEMRRPTNTTPPA